MNPASTPVSREQVKVASEFFRGLFVVLPLMFAGIFLQGLVVVLLWHWFIVLLGVKALSYWQGIGLMLLIGFVRYNNLQPPQENIKRDSEYYYSYLKRGYGVMIFTLVAGWLVHLLS